MVRFTRRPSAEDSREFSADEVVGQFTVVFDHVAYGVRSYPYEFGLEEDNIRDTAERLDAGGLGIAFGDEGLVGDTE